MAGHVGPHLLRCRAGVRAHPSRIIGGRFLGLLCIYYYSDMCVASQARLGWVNVSRKPQRHANNSVYSRFTQSC